MRIVTTGDWPQHYSERGINGQIDDLLFLINHGMLFYPGFTILPHFVIYRVDRLETVRFEIVSKQLRKQMRTLTTIAPIHTVSRTTATIRSRRWN